MARGGKDIPYHHRDCQDVGAPGQGVSYLCLARGDEWSLGLAACSEGLKNNDYESMTPEVVIAKPNS